MRAFFTVLLLLYIHSARSQYTDFKHINYYIVNADTKLQKPEIAKIHVTSIGCYAELPAQSRPKNLTALS